ncbi:tripartite tricarboxylate transporter TctB family protein [Clostridium sp.]
MRKGNIIISCVFILIGILVLVNVSTFPSMGPDQITGPEFFPGLLALILIVLSAVLFISNYRSKDQSPTGLFDEYAIKAYITMAGLVGYLVLINIVGFIIATPILLFGLMRFYGMKQYPKLVLSSVIITGAIYGVFKLLLAVPLPTGIIG